MDTKNIFKHGKKISAKMFRANYRQSKATQGFLENETVAGVLNERTEKEEFNRVMRDRSKGGLSRRGAQEGIGEMKTLTNEEKRRLAKEIFPNLPSGQRIIKPTEKPKSNARKKPTGSREKNSATPPENSAMTPVKMASLMNKARIVQGESQPGEDKTSKGGFSSAMAATMRNKK